MRSTDINEAKKLQELVEDMQLQLARKEKEIDDLKKNSMGSLS